MNTLVLNASYEILEIVNWKKSIIWKYLDKVDVIEEYNKFIKTPSIAIRIPAVIKHKKVIKPKRRTLKFTKINLYARDNFQCCYCQIQLPYYKLTVDHVIPRSRGGNKSWENCVSCCLKCNIKKGNKTPREAGMKLIKQPKCPNYEESLLYYLNLKIETIPDIWKNYLPESILNNRR